MYVSQLPQIAPLAAALLMAVIGLVGALAGRAAVSLACNRLHDLRSPSQAGTSERTNAMRFSILAMPACAVLFMCIAWGYGITVQGIALCALVFFLVALSVTDVHARIIPNAYLLACLAVWCVAYLFALLRACGVLPEALEGICMFGIANGTSAFTDTPYDMQLGAVFFGICNGNAPLAVLIDSLSGAFGVSILVYLVSALLDRINGKRNLGAGDVKLLFVTGLFLGLGVNVLNLMLSCVLGGILGLASMRTHDTSFPFGPAIAISSALCIVFGPGILAIALS